MINLALVEKYCKDYKQIANYEEAMNDKSQTWHCHHILGEILSREQLKEHDFYYDVPPCMLKFMTSVEHHTLHLKGKSISDDTRKKMSEAHNGIQFTEEHRRNMSEAHKGKLLSNETKRKMSEAKKGGHHSEETKQKMRDAWARRKKAKTTLEDNK